MHSHRCDSSVESVWSAISFNVDVLSGISSAEVVTGTVNVTHLGGRGGGIEGGREERENSYTS